jgi:hypothetical protein
MKTLKITALILFVTVTTFAQDCSTFYPFEQGVVSTVTSYNKKGKMVGAQEVTIVSVGLENGYDTATAKAILKDKKGKKITETNFDVTCKNGGVEVDIASMMSPELFNQFEGMETDISGTNVVLPNNLAVDDELPDASMQMKIDMGGITMNMTVEMTDRKVLAEESLTTPAGTFNCYVIEYTSKVKMGMARSSKAKQWIAKGVGLVKQEEYNKKGKITSYSLLTAFSK